ncbi:hypothetical protein [Serpentinicella alkaliphila]|uniref:Uncharacterized protein n=1 Tax=Serpentinicella alkaliphila TaxID=1734049 RepID=A0A4V6NSE6_9FIRM|nr:hypothetical protein [Serpentinicella alkaliphila]QUH25913.1 hypothetical protein HZR23_09325 [Serpentinicella alkaliphila]TCQ01984.1 hypothetical protein EDD79_102040 [Serpentinicella alkaliphila]
MKQRDLEKYSSAITLSDMEIFIFPELLYSLLLANIMSPVVWEWKKDPWFDKIEKMSPYRKILRLKQFIMDKYDFNLDLETWGLTTKETEIHRFNPFMDEEILSKSNALFGYEGDKYYFKVDIRKHFRLDKYDSNVIPYWKTETIEAMEAFKYKEGYHKGAGECVSLSTLYAAALFIICKIPLEDIYLLATPLHSQNFVDINEGLMTNNRRLVTKNMWFNGTELTLKAQRALRNEQVTIISHNTGYIHVIYPDATLDKKAYEKFEKKLKKFLITDVDSDIIYNFLRQESQFQKCFQVKELFNGKYRYIGAEKAYAYEHTSSHRINDSTRDKLFSEIDEYEFFLEPLEDRICLNKFNEYFKSHKIDFRDKGSCEEFSREFDCMHIRKEEILKSLFEFCYLNPKLPGKDKNFIDSQAIKIANDMEREDIISYLESIRENNITADLAFYAFRDFSKTDLEPFIKASIERNPVIIDALKSYDLDVIIEKLHNMTNESIYDGTRVSQPDEVWNFQRGDGIEKAISLANILKNRDNNMSINIEINEKDVFVYFNDRSLKFTSNKGMVGKIQI